ncbi:hypothetical protein PAMP_012778 [Pampus punctatissimus]
MVRLVFRPYTQVGRPICTSGPLRASTRVSSGFALPRHSSPSFGSYRTRSRSTSPTVRARRAGGAPEPRGAGIPPQPARAGPHFHCATGYLLTIGLVPVFSLRWSLPPALGCIPKQPDSEKTGPRRDGGRYRPHTVHGLSLDQKDSGPRATPGKRSSVRHISHARPSDGDSALGSSLFARRY